MCKQDILGLAELKVLRENNAVIAKVICLHRSKGSHAEKAVNGSPVLVVDCHQKLLNSTSAFPKHSKITLH